MLSVTGLMEPMPRLFLPNTIDNIRHYPSAITMATNTNTPEKRTPGKREASPTSPATLLSRSLSGSSPLSSAIVTPPTFNSTSFSEMGCSDIGRCQDGREIRFSFLANKGYQINRPNGFVLVGARSPQLGATTLLAVVDRSYLPDEEGRASQGFVGDCVGCGRRFRFFTEFSHHINLKLATQPKKQKHLKYYIDMTSNGELIRGKPLGWKVLPETRRRSRTSSFLDILPGSPNVFGQRLNVPCLQISLPTQLPQSTVYSSFGLPPPSKKICWDGMDPGEFSAPSMLTPPIKHNTPTDIALPIIMVCQKEIPILSSTSKMLPVCLLLQGTFVYDGGLERTSVYNMQSPHLPTLLAIHYFASLLPDTPIRREDADAYIDSASRELTSSISADLALRGDTYSQSQIASLARLVSSCSNGKLEVTFCSNLTEGIDAAYNNIKSKRAADENKAPIFTFVIQNEKFWQPEFIVIVSGPIHLCSLVWSVGDEMAEDDELSDEEEEMEEEIDVVQESRKENVKAQCSSPLSVSFGNADELLLMLKQFRSGLGGKFQSPFKCTNQVMTAETILNLKPELSVIVDTIVLCSLRNVTAEQIQVGEQLFSVFRQIANKSSNLDLSQFTRINVGFITAPFHSSYVQTIERVLHSELLQAMSIEDNPDFATVEKYVFKGDSDQNDKFERFIEEAEQNKNTLCILIHDDAHIQSTDGSGQEWVNSKTVLNSPNIIVLQVTATPYCLQSVASIISIDHPYQNEVSWTSIPQQYCGIQFYKTSRDDVSQSPLIRADSTFDRMVIKKMISDQQTKPVSCRVNILTRHYSAAMVCVCSVNFAESFTTTETMQVIHELIETPLKNPSGHGVMVVLRIASEKLGRLAHERITLVRDSLGLTYRFAVIFDNGRDNYDIDDYFLFRLRHCQKGRDDNWKPCRPEHLANLPCLLIRTGVIRAGDTFPCSMRYYDMRAFYTATQSRTILEQEIGNLYGYSAPMEALFIRPRCLVPSQILPYLDDADLPGRSMMMIPHLNCKWLQRQRPLLKPTSTPAEQSRYYREFLLSLVDMETLDTTGSTKIHPRRILLSGPKQIGKTGAVFQFLGLVQQFLKQQQEVQVISVRHEEKTDEKYEEFRSWPAYTTIKSQSMTTAQTDFSGTVRGDVVNVQFTQLTSHSSYHFCDTCHNYRFGSGQRNAFIYKLRNEELMFFIPDDCLSKFFISVDSQGYLQSLILPHISDDGTVNSPIFTPSRSRHDIALLNLHHTMEGTTHTHIVVVTRSDMDLYITKWTNHVIMVLPESAENAGFGVYRHWIKRFAEHNYKFEQSRNPDQEIWPFISILGDNTATWTMTKCSPDNANDRSEKSVSLYKALCHLEKTPDIGKYAVIYASHWRKDMQHKKCFDRGFSSFFQLLNVNLTDGIEFNNNRYMNDDLEFYRLVNYSGLTTCRFNMIQVQLRHLKSGGDIALLPEKVLPLAVYNLTSNSVDVSKLITLPDKTESFILAVPSHYLLECFLYHGSSEILFTATERHHPILQLDCYFSLGPYLSTVSTLSQNIDNLESTVEFGGLLLYFTSNRLNTRQLRSLNFVKGAKLCVIARDREELREEILRLDLEENWRFRFRDEFRTSSKEAPIYFLTGTHI